MQVVGIFKGSFEDSKTNRLVEYAKIYCLNEVIKKGLDGVEVEILKVSHDVANSVRLGDVVEPNYNKYGRVTGFFSLDEEQ